MPALVTIVLAAWWFIYRPLAEQPQDWTPVESSFALCGERFGEASGCVVDGDTVFIGEGARRRRIRLTGYDAPELDADCAGEQAVAQEARRALHQWLATGAFEWSGGSEPPRDQYGRELREARRLTGENTYEYLAETMIDADLAADSGWGANEIDWCTR